jgi:hypothetical protein
MMQYLRRFIDPRNQYCRWIDSRVSTLRPAVVIAYLSQRGWKQLPPDRKGLLAFQEPTGELMDGRPLCQFVPDSEEYGDYAQCMFELLTGLADFENRQASEVIDDMVSLSNSREPNGVGQGLSASGEHASK